MTVARLTNPYFTFPAPLPELPARPLSDPGGPTFIERAALTASDAQGVTLSGTTQTDELLTVTVRIVAPGVVRVLLQADDSDPDRVRLARESSEPVPVTITDLGESITLASDDARVQIALDPFKITFHGPDGALRLAQDPTNTIVIDRLHTLPLGFSRIEGQRVAFHDSFAAEPDEHFYGFGEKFTDFDKRGQVLEMWAYDALGVHGERTYKNVPFFISTRGYGVFVDSLTAIRFDMAATNNALWSLIVPDSGLDYYVILGPHLKTIISRYAALVSYPTLPPKWSFGLWMSSGFFQDHMEDVLARARELREKQIPCDVLHLDCYWQRFGCWSDMIWDPQNFPDPDGMIARAKAQDFKICLWMNPYLGIESERFTEAKERGFLLKTADGEPWVGDVWSGGHPPVGIIDMTHPAAVDWFKDSLRPLLRQGIDSFKTDFGEAIPAHTVAHNGMTGAQLHNLYPLLYNDAVYEVTREMTGRAPVVWGRSTYAGGQRHAAQWGGDPNCTYQALAATLRGGLSLAMCGHAFWSHDMGGFHAQPTVDLYARWLQLGVFSPMARAHGMTSRLPWDFGAEFEALFMDYVRLRYRLLPYLYTYAVCAAETGLPILRPMVLEYPDDPHTYTMDLQYMFGEDFLVAPLYNAEGKRPVYFPAGAWVDYWTHEVIQGPQTRFVQVDLATLPLYVRAGALIPTIEPPQHIEEGPFVGVTFDGYLIERGEGELRDVDGTTQISARIEQNALRVEVDGPAKALRMRLIPLAGAPAVHKVVVNGVTLGRMDAAAESATSVAGWTSVKGEIVVTPGRQSVL